MASIRKPKGTSDGGEFAEQNHREPAPLDAPTAGPVTVLFETG